MNDNQGIVSGKNTMSTSSLTVPSFQGAPIIVEKYFPFTYRIIFDVVAVVVVYSSEILSTSTFMMKTGSKLTSQESKTTS